MAPVRPVTRPRQSLLPRVASGPLIGGTAGFLVGWSVWRPDGLSFAWLLILAALCASRKPRIDQFFAFLGYYFAALRLPLTSLRDYDPTPSGILLAGCGQLALAILLAAPYALLSGGEDGSCWRAGTGAILALTLSAMPPLGCVGLASPLFGASDWFPGWGLRGLALYLILFGSCVMVVRCLASSRAALYALILIIPAAILGAIGVPAVAPPVQGGLYCTHTSNCPGHQVIAVSYPFGPTVHNWHGFVKRARLITRLGTQALKEDPKARLLVFPEEVAGPLDRAFPSLYAHLASALRAHRVTAALGALVPWHAEGTSLTPGSQVSWSDGMVFIGQHNQVLIARQPAPVVEWNPLAGWFRNQRLAMPAFWRLPIGPSTRNHPPLDHIAWGKTHLAALICYEQALVWPLIWTMIHHRPGLVLAPESVHWEASSAPGNLEARLARGWGRLYGLPVAVAVNLPKKTHMSSGPESHSGSQKTGVWHTTGPMLQSIRILR